MIVTESNSPQLERKIIERVYGAQYKFENFEQNELKSVVAIMVGEFSCYEIVCMANMISPKVGLTSAKFEM